MVIILNNNTEYMIPATNFQLDYIKDKCFIKNYDLNGWSTEIMTYLASLINMPVTSIIIKQNAEDDNIMKEYNDLTGKVEKFAEEIQDFPGEFDRPSLGLDINLHTNS